MPRWEKKIAQFLQVCLGIDNLPASGGSGGDTLNKPVVAQGGGKESAELRKKRRT